MDIRAARAIQMVAIWSFVMPTCSNAEVQTKVVASDGTKCISYQSGKYLDNPTVFAQNRCSKRIAIYAIKPSQKVDGDRLIFFVEPYDAEKKRHGTGQMRGSASAPPTVVAECVALDGTCTKKWNRWMRE